MVNAVQTVSRCGIRVQQQADLISAVGKCTAVCHEVLSCVLRMCALFVCQEEHRDWLDTVTLRQTHEARGEKGRTTLGGSV